MIHLFNKADPPIRLHSGSLSSFKIDCDALTDEDLQALAYQIGSRTGSFTYGKVHGIPTGGERFADALRPYCQDYPYDLIVDDVLTSGGSMEAARNLLMARGSAKGHIGGLVIFARGPCPPWVDALFTVTSPLLLGGYF